MQCKKSLLIKNESFSHKRHERLWGTGDTAPKQMEKMSCQSSRHGRFISGQGATGTHRIRRWGNPEWRLWRRERSYATREWNSLLISDVKIYFARHSVHIRSAGLSDWLRRYGWTVTNQTTLPTVRISRTVISISLGPLRSTWLASDLYRTPTWSSCLRHRHFTPISSTQELQALLPRCVEFFTVNDNCVKVWCVPFATNVPDISDSLSVLSLLYNVLYQLHIKMYTMLNVVSFQDRWRNYYTNITSMVKQWHLCSFHSGSAHYSSGMYALLAKPAC